MKKLLAITSFLAVVSGLVMVIGGMWGAYYTYKNVTQEKIITPEDASIPNAPVAGPLTLKAQADIIRTHALRIGNGLTYAEMPRQVAKLDASGKPLLDAEGKAIMVDNTARNTWITATALITALSLGIISYAFSALAVFLGLAFLWGGIVSFALSKRF